MLYEYVLQDQVATKLKSSLGDCSGRVWIYMLYKYVLYISMYIYTYKYITCIYIYKYVYICKYKEYIYIKNPG